MLVILLNCIVLFSGWCVIIQLPFRFISLISKINEHSYFFKKGCEQNANKIIKNINKPKPSDFEGLYDLMLAWEMRDGKEVF